MKDFLHPLRVIHGNIGEWRRIILPLYSERLKHPQAVFLLLTPEHGNLGDHAIAQSETELLCELNIPYIEITGKQLQTLAVKKALHIMNGRAILINGGGYLGTLWPSSEKITREIISSNPNSQIIILPNTIYYDANENGRLELNRSIELYNVHQHLKLYAREKHSYEKMKNIYKNVALAPDMVLRMNKCKSGIKRNGCILCLRNDHEKTRSKEIEKIINKTVKSKFGDNVVQLDMVTPHPISISERDAELDKQYEAFRHAELVITDRLHGMIFSAITGTPCIVIDSKSPKVRGCYEWIQDLPYIQFCENAKEILSIYESIPKQEWQYDNSKLLPLYEPLKDDINRAIKRKRNVSN